MRFRLLAFAAAMLLVACGDRGQQEARARERGAKPFVLFLQREMWIERLGVPVDAPIAAGSAPSRKTMESDDEDVVEIDHSGRLVARSNGVANVRSASGGSALRVVVLVPDDLRIEPQALRLAPGTNAALTARSSAGLIVPRERVSWGTDRPDLVSVRDGTVTALGPAGSARIHVAYGTLGADASVEVDGNPEAFRILPTVGDLKLGSLTQFKALTRTGPVDAVWSSTQSSVVKHVGRGIFQALANGKAQVCARAFRLEICQNVRVRK